MNFEDASPVKVSGSGRKKADNPYTDIIAQIALKTTEDDKPVAKKFVTEHAEGQRDAVIARIKRQMSEAGADNDPKCTVRVHAEAVKNPVNGVESTKKTLITFWTVKRQERPKSRTAAAPDAQ